MKKPGQKLGFFMCVALVMGNMIGSGVFLLPASLAPFGWNGVVGWAITIAGALALAWVLSRLTLAHPEAGGPVGFVARAFGPLPGYMIGWSYWVSIWTANVTIAVAGVSYASVFLPILGEHAALSTIALLWITTAINLRGARAAGGFQMVTLLLKLVPLIAVIVLIFWVLGREGSAAVQPFPKEGLSLAAVNGSAILTLWALLGFESACIATDKVDDPVRNIPRATMAGTLATGVLYLIVCSGIALMLPADQLGASTAPFELFVTTHWSHGPALLIAAFAAISAIGALNGWTLLQAEFPAAMARRGLMPEWFAAEDRNGVPVRALLLATGIASVLVLLNTSKSTGQLFTFMATLSTSATLWLYLACAIVALRFRIAIPVAIFGLLYALWTLWGAGTYLIGGIDVNVSVLTFVLMATGLPFYLWAPRSTSPQPAA